MTFGKDARPPIPHSPNAARRPGFRVLYDASRTQWGGKEFRENLAQIRGSVEENGVSSLFSDT